jgi:hypothetical protein
MTLTHTSTFTITLSLPRQAVQVKAAPFLVQEVPLPLSPHPAGAAWLKLKASAPPVGGVFDHTGAFYRQTSVRVLQARDYAPGVGWVPIATLSLLQTGFCAGYV